MIPHINLCCDTLYYLAELDTWGRNGYGTQKCYSIEQKCCLQLSVAMYLNSGQ